MKNDNARSAFSRIGRSAGFVSSQLSGNDGPHVSAGSMRLRDA